MLALSLVAITVAFVAGLMRGIGFTRFVGGRLMFDANLKSRNTWCLRVRPDGIVVSIQIEAEGLGGAAWEVLYEPAEVDELMALWVKQSGAAERLAQKQETSNG